MSMNHDKVEVECLGEDLALTELLVTQVLWNHDHDQGEGEEEAGNGVTCDVGPVTISYSAMQ